MLKFDFPVYAPENEGDLYYGYMRGKDETARDVLLTVMRDLHPGIAGELNSILSDKLHAFMSDIVHQSRKFEWELRDMRGGFLGALFNTQARQAGCRKASECESAYDADVRKAINKFADEQFPDCLKSSIQQSHHGNTCSYLNDVSNRLNHLMVTKYTSAFEFYHPPYF